VNRKGVSVVYGDVGTGKSTLARIMHEHFLEQGQGKRTRPLTF
jgi:polynucleotide 5'-kinase involved in rRNA processing